MKFEDRTIFSRICTIVAFIGCAWITALTLGDIFIWFTNHTTAMWWILGSIWALACFIHCVARIRIFGGAPQ